MGSAKDAALGTVGAVSAATLSAGDRAAGHVAQAMRDFDAEDPEDAMATVTCSELKGQLAIRPGKGRLEILNAWFGHPSDASRRKDITKEARKRVTFYNSLNLPASTQAWGNPAPWCAKVLSVTYRREREDGDDELPGEALRAAIAKDTVAAALRRGSYEALKQVAGSPAAGSWLCITQVRLGLPVPGSSLHLIFVSFAELLLWSGEHGVHRRSYMTLLMELGTISSEVVRRPPSKEAAEAIIDRAHGLLGAKTFKDSQAFAAECHGADAGVDLNSLKTAGQVGAAVVVAAHVDEAAAAIALPLLGAGGAAAIGVAGALVVSPLLLAGIWKVQRRNGERQCMAFVNLTGSRISLRAFDLDDPRCSSWAMGMVKSSCNGVGGRSDGELGHQDLVELNPPSEAELFQLRCCKAAAHTSGFPHKRAGAGATSRHSGSFEESADLTNEAHDAEVDREQELAACVQTVARGSVYWILCFDAQLVVREVPRKLIPAYADPSEGKLDQVVWTALAAQK